MRFLRLFLGITFVLSVLGGLGVLAWATHHPDHPRVTAARDWPLLGSAVARFQQQYLYEPTPDSQNATAPSSVAPYATTPPTDSSGQTFDAKPSLWVTPGTKLYERPSADAALVLTFDRYANLMEIEESAGWIRIRFKDRVGWLEPRPDEEPILGRGTEPLGPIASAPPDRERLKSAQARLGMALNITKLGPYTLYTDSRNQVLIERLRRLAPQLDDVFARRFGLRPIGEPAEAVVLFERFEDYRAFKNQTARLVGLNAAGHAGRGMAAFFRGEQDLDDVTAVFVHEITHLISHRAVGPALPLWLGEGLAETLASSRFLPWGGIDVDAWGGSRRRIGNRTTFSGEWIARQKVKDAIRENRLPALDRMIGIDDDIFQNGAPTPGLHYTVAGTFFRYLLDGDGGRHRTAFQSFLQGVASGEPATTTVLLDRLKTPWAKLDSGYRSWMLEQGD